VDNYTALEISKKTGNADGSSLKQIAESQAALDKGKILQAKEVNLNGQPAYMISYTSESKNQRAMALAVFNNSTSDYFVFKYKSPTSTYDNYISAIGNIIKSVKYSNNNLSSATMEQPTSSNVTIKENVEKPSSSDAGVGYKLIVYLDGPHNGNTIGDNFKIVVYNSDHKEILSAKPTIDFNDNHQKISPKKGYSIGDKTGQHPQQINVCAQQKYGLDGKTKNHDDCYPIKQNIQKTNWYTIFDYGQIDGYEGDLTQNTNVPRLSDTSNGNSIIMNATMR